MHKPEYQDGITQIDPRLLDKFVPILHGSALKVLFATLRNERRVWSYPEIVDSGGIKRNMPHRDIMDICGFGSVATSIRAVRELEQHGLLAQEKRDGYVYFIECGDYYKIGCSQKPQKQLKQLDVGPEKCELVYLIPTEDMYELEAWFHKKFYHRLTRREWFILQEEDLKFIECYPGVEEQF